MDKRHSQLGMNVGTASNRLVKDILFSLIKNTPCFRCGGKLKRENFSVEHKTAWLNSEDPVGLFFDLDNISFSHQSCNAAAGDRPNKKYRGYLERKRASRDREKVARSQVPVEIRKVKRREQYLRTGK
jgi:hypothetical protein